MPSKPLYRPDIDGLRAIAVALVAVAFRVVTVRIVAPLARSDVRAVFARHGAGRAPTAVQSDPDAPGRWRPRAPGSAVLAA